MSSDYEDEILQYFRFNAAGVKSMRLIVSAVDSKRRFFFCR